VFYIVEQDKELQELEAVLSDKPCYLDIILSNDYFHPKLTYIVAVYLRGVSQEKGYIIPINHSEGLNVSNNRIYQLLKNIPTLYTLNKKNLLYHFNLQDATDLSLLYSMNKFDKLNYSGDISTINWYYSNHSSRYDLNTVIPISKLFERCELVYEQVCEYITLELPSGFEFYNTTATNVFYLLEQNGVGIRAEDFVKTFSPNNPIYNIENNTAYTSYNLYNSTSRPTNAFNSINFAAIPKTLEHRRCFLPKNDYFMEFDFDGYHVRLLCEQIGYELTQESAHRQLARQYFKKQEITEEEYAKAKQINFQAIYGAIPQEHAHLPIFKKIQEYINELWSKYQNNGVIMNPISGKPFTKELKETNPSKLMNYMMQSLETSRNILIVKQILKYLQNKKSKIVLYTYDSFIVDLSLQDGREVADTIVNIMEEGKKYPVRVKYSKDLVLDL